VDKQNQVCVLIGAAGPTALTENELTPGRFKGYLGYTEMIKILKDPDNDRYEDMHEWAGDLDPESSSPSEVDLRLEYAFRDSPPRKLLPAGPKNSGKGKLLNKRRQRAPFTLPSYCDMINNVLGLHS
jgi:hypothetical protein